MSRQLQSAAGSTSCRSSSTAMPSRQRRSWPVQGEAQRVSSRRAWVHVPGWTPPATQLLQSLPHAVT
eukprot:scaffold27693_cov48-Phaeocystis_antarctica.AAC.2